MGSPAQSHTVYLQSNWDTCSYFSAFAQSRDLHQADGTHTTPRPPAQPPQNLPRKYVCRGGKSQVADGPGDAGM